jgi:hypothetical protein
MGYHFSMSTGEFFADRNAVPRHQHTQKKQRKRNGTERDEMERGPEKTKLRRDESN